MSNLDSQSLPGVLFVDDEDKARKYFEMAFNKKYRVFTAESGKRGLEILQQEHAGLCLVVSDQRMPEMLGVDFLSQVRKIYPDKIRILTTAYSDLESAIRSVNEGKIYQYVTKPWDLQDFQMVLQRAHDYYTILSERDHLMALKMSTLQRIIMADRVKMLASVASAGGIQAPDLLTNTLAALLGHLPRGLDLNPASGGAAMLQHGLAQFMQQERRASATILKAWQGADFELGACMQALAGCIQAGAGEPLRELSVEPFDAGVQLRFAAEETHPDRLYGHFLGVLCEAEPSPLSLAFFQLVAAATQAGKTVRVGTMDAAENDAWLSIPAKAEAEGDELEAILAELYDKWDTAMLGR
ncbi:MAG: response regulator [Puniceicoccaceae bacterium]|nr:MAG: response regulator [Puniceicoccaceae bacterium]